ncbi:uncharacterized protein LOC125065034 [Vanessa atalanta]|uniref:uncharacterized protein LOC125065034 n=1 Tax=Vanessa atalanta TaxID=42275 RepID=UPI001FCDB155|nr:uncharacterized protein LOC125065034 [Vanessa atalanta]
MALREFGLLFLFLIILQLKMADSNRIVFPDEVEQVKMNIVAESQATKTNTVEEVTEVPEEVDVKTRNMIVTPPNCPPGQKMGADGVCRDIF